jgi:hypothetical protein
MRYTSVFKKTFKNKQSPMSKNSSHPVTLLSKWIEFLSPICGSRFFFLRRDSFIPGIDGGTDLTAREPFFWLPRRQGDRMLYFQTKNSNLDKFWRALD